MSLQQTCLTYLCQDTVSKAYNSLVKYERRAAEYTDQFVLKERSDIGGILISVLAF